MCMFFKISDPPTNSEVAEILRAVAAAYVIRNVNQFRIRAYEKAADSVEHASREVYDMWQDGTLGELPGIGGSIGQHLDELFRTGKSENFDKTFEGLPPGMFAILPIPGIGPKHAYQLSLQLGLTRYHSAVAKLEKAARQGQISKLEGFQEAGEARILQGIEEFKLKSNRLLLHIADKDANEIIIYLKKLQFVKQAYPLGSLRRRVTTVGDIDIAVATDNPEETIKHFIAYPSASRVIDAGKTSATLLLRSNVHVDLIVQPVASYGSLLQHFTGSKHHNIALREIALQKGLSLSEKGITETTGEKVLHEFETEEKFYNFLGMDWIPPEIREDRGEIKAAMKHSLPNLIRLEDLKGDYHMHSDLDIETSHDLGLSSMEEMAQTGVSLGYEYIALSEHNPKFSLEPSQIVELMKKKCELVKKLNVKLAKTIGSPFRVFNSLEIDIRTDGSLAFPEEAFEYLDFAIASVHSSFRQSKEEMTARVLKALAHPKIKILGHPTGRIINQRQGFELDWKQIFEFCLEHDKWLEIDGWPDRLDLPDTQAREAIEAGLSLVISSDAHQADHMRMIRYGIDTARRAWVEKKHVINCLTLAEFEKRLGKK